MSGQPTTPAETAAAAIEAARAAVLADELAPLGDAQEISVRLLVEHLGLTLDQARRTVVLGEAGSVLLGLRIRAGFAQMGAAIASATANMRRLGGDR